MGTVVPYTQVYLLDNILSDKNAKSQGYGTYWANRLHFRDGIGVKTGTSEYKTDNWTFGYTNSIQLEFGWEIRQYPNEPSFLLPVLPELPHLPRYGGNSQR